MKKPCPAKKIGRKRRVAGWSLLIPGVIVAALWMVSGWIWLDWQSSKWAAWVDSGRAGITLADTAIARQTGFRCMTSLGWHCGGPGWEWYKGADGYFAREERRDYFVLWTETWYLGTALGTTCHARAFGVFLLPIPLLLFPPGALLLSSGIIARRWAITGMCKKCGYSLAGLPAGSPCPECGKGAGTK